MLNKPKVGRTAFLVDAVRYSITIQSADIDYARKHFTTPSQAFRELIAAHRLLNGKPLNQR